MSSRNPFELMSQRRFLPFFVTQFLGAFNDNLFKIALVMMVSFSASYSDSEKLLFANIANGLFILPFFIFSATFGQLADKYEKAQLIRVTKIMEIVIMAVALLGFYLLSLPILLTALFLMGAQSTLFGPVKYGILPQHLRRDELMGGNGLIEMGTFVAILLGQLLAGYMLNIGMLHEAAMLMVGLSFMGLMTSIAIPPAPASDPNLKINWNFFTETTKLIRYTAQHREVFLAVLGISWFWFYGAMILAQMPVYASLVLNGSESVFSLILATFTVGIGIGSVLCEKMSQGRIELGLVPFGSIGLTIFAVDLFFASDFRAGAELASFQQFISESGSWRVIADMFLMGLFGGFYIVPLYTMVQTRTPETHISRVIAANNILNAGFMVVAAGVGAGLLAAGAEIPHLFLLCGVLTAIVSVIIFRLMPEFVLRFFAWMLINTIYRLRVRQIEQVPQEGAAVLVCNHVSYVDAIVIAAAVSRPIRFIMDHRIFKVPVLSWIFRTMRTIPIASAKEDPELKEKAMNEAAEALRNGELICIFPEGKLTADGEMNPFRPGVEDILSRCPAPVIPMALQGLWHSFFSRRGGAAMRGLPYRFFKKIQLVVGEPMAVTAKAEEMESVVRELRGDQR